MRKVKLVQIEGWSGQRRCEPVDRELTLPDIWGIALVKYKSMEELIKEFPDHFFDCHGNFCNGKHGHLAPSYFGQMGHTAHRKYEKSEGIKDEWYFTVIDR